MIHTVKCQVCGLTVQRSAGPQHAELLKYWVCSDKCMRDPRWKNLPRRLSAPPVDEARAIIKRNGGPTAVARVCCVHRTTVFRWQSGKSPMSATAFRLLEEIERGGGVS